MHKFACPKCGKPIGIDERMAGQKVRCPACKSVMRVPANLAKTPAAPAQPAARQVSAAGATTTTPPPGRYNPRRKQSKNSAFVFGGIAVLCVLFLVVLIVAAINQTNNATPQPAAAPTPTPAPAINVDKTPSASTGAADESATMQDGDDTSSVAPRPGDPPIRSGSGNVSIAGVEFDAAGNPVNAPKSTAQSSTPLPGFEPFYDQFEDTMTLRSRPSLLVKAADAPQVEKAGNLYFGVSVTYPGREPVDADHAKIFLEVTASGTEWQSQEPNPSLALVVFWGDQHEEIPVEHKKKVASIANQPTERLQYLWSLEKLQAMVKAGGVKAMVQGQSYNLGSDHLESFRRLIEHLKPDRAG